jgi:gliding motility-associated-like protein
MFRHRTHIHMHLRICSVLIFLLLVIAPRARATHLYGADFYYEHISGNTYRISLAIYGDCNLAPETAFRSLWSVAPVVHIFDGATQISQLSLRLVGNSEEVTPVCDRELSNTTCKSTSGTIPGVMRFVFSGSYTFGYASPNWRFRFDGNTPVGYSAGRSAIDNLSGTSITALEALLNNMNGPNSSPRFTTIPTPFYCINVAQQYNHGAVDANNDSLDYALIPGMNGGGGNGLGAGGGNVLYNTPYSGALPMNGDAVGWTLNGRTGQLNFTPVKANKYLIVNQVKEYRNGQVVGTSMREMTFIILANCNNKPSESNLDTSRISQAGVFVDRDEVTICQLTDTGKFTILPTNRSGDTIVASITGLPPGVFDTVLGNNTPRPVIQLSWIKANLAPGLYNFFVTYKDRGCPLTSQQTKAFTLRVIAPNDLVGPDVITPTQCFHKAWVQFTPTFGLLPRTITISQGGTVIKTIRDISGAAFADSLEAGVYTIDINSDNLQCPTQKSLTVPDGGTYPHVPTVDDRFHCLDDKPEKLELRSDTGAFVNWYASDGTLLPGAPTPQTNTPGRTFYLIDQQRRTCHSRRDTFWVYVTKRPTASITGDPVACVYDTATLRFNGAIGEGPILEYNWKWGTAYYKSGEGPGPWHAAWASPGIKQVRLQVAENKCPSDTADFFLSVRPKPYAGFEIPPLICQYDTVTVSYQATPLKNQTYSWSFPGAGIQGSSESGPLRIYWPTPGTKRVSLMASLDGCSDTRSRDVIVRESPDIHILNVPATVCIGEKIYLQATGATAYTWLPRDSVREDGSGIYTHVLKPSIYKVIGRNEYYCWDSASIEYPVVEQCCTFTYPNAFTPNGDGRNDKFNAVTYGNHKEYELNIYNRWGERVFIGHSPTESWDGTYAGKQCDAGTYFYQLNALCYTGHREFRTGDLILIR